MQSLPPVRHRVGAGWGGVAAGLGAGLATLLLTAPHALAGKPEPQGFSIPKAPPGEEPGFTVEVYPEQRTRVIAVEPLELNGVVARDVHWAEQRLRLNLVMAREDLAAIFVQADVLDGVLFGDNGVFGREPTTSTGMGITSKQANLAGWRVGLLPGHDPLDLESYAPVLRPIAPIAINWAYGELSLPFGIIRLGRQPLADLGTLAINDGRDRNRWGASWYHNSVDRFLFATKISEAFKMLANGPGYKPNRGRDNGVFMGLFYDLLVQDDIFRGDDDLSQTGLALDARYSDFRLLGVHFDRAWLATTASFRWDARYKTRVWAIPVRAGFETKHLRLSSEFTALLGETMELSAGMTELTGGDPSVQKLEAYGARVSLEGTWGPLTLVGEWDYATGDDDPRPDSPINTFQWARDTNLGLLLFEHTLAFQSARSAAVGIENLKQLNAESFPLAEVATDGRVNNINGFFPQVFYDPIDDLTLKLGVLFAWSQVPIVDPIQTVLAWDGEQIADDAVNYNGGPAGNYWGTEIDLGAEYRYEDVFEAALEGAYLLPGNGFRDANGDAVPSWMVEARFTFRL